MPAHPSCCLHSSLHASSTSVGLPFLQHMNIRSLIHPPSQPRNPGDCGTQEAASALLSTPSMSHSWRKLLTS